MLKKLRSIYILIDKVNTGKNGQRGKQAGVFGIVQLLSFRHHSEGRFLLGVLF